MSRCEQPAAVFSFCLINGIHHSRIGRKNHTALFRIVLAVQEITQRQIREKIAVIILCLFHQCFAVCEKQDIFHIVVPSQHIDNTDAHSRLA